ncbi:hypothetical protein DH2020_010846 [Rehmannia glutinosa]|uniref:BHLH domain-containing protein n=1 Tax=Rehmannia glutinosa TaxID=99300 RepID=A0ABR0XCB8_REHGL
MLASSQFDPASSHDDFLEQMLSSVPSSAATSFPWADDHAPPQLDEQSTAVLASKLRQHQISNGAAKALMLQQQLLLSRSLAAANGLRSPTGADGGLLPMPHGDHNDVVDGNSFKPANPGESLQAQNFGAAGAAAAPAMNQPAASGSSGGGAGGQPRQRVRARRGQATDPHSIAERLRRERIAERMKALQELVPNANKEEVLLLDLFANQIALSRAINEALTDKASMLDEIIDYVKFLQLQVKVLSMSRLGGASAVAPLVADMSSEQIYNVRKVLNAQGRSGNGTQTASSSNNDGMTVTEHQVAKLMEEDMGSAMQYLQGKGLCLMPISLATAISTTTSHSRNPLLPPSTNINGTNNNHPLLNGEARGPTSPSMSVLTNQSATIGGNGGGEPSLKDAASVSKP